MWIPKRFVENMERENAALRSQIAELQTRCGQYLGAGDKLLQENVTLKANQEWFKLRLNMVEKERAQLIFAAIGTKISVPEFVPTYDAPETALAEQPDFAAVGEDARTDADYSLMPERANN